MRFEELKIQRPPTAVQSAGRLKCSQCGAVNADDANNCEKCGEPLYLNCVECGVKNLRSRSECRFCEHPFRLGFYRAARKWIFERHGRLILKIIAVVCISFFASKVIYVVAQMGGGNDEGTQAVSELPPEGGAPVSRVIEVDLSLPAPGKKK
jgi:ribosomal protein L40E